MIIKKIQKFFVFFAKNFDFFGFFKKKIYIVSNCKKCASSRTGFFIFSPMSVSEEGFSKRAEFAKRGMLVKPSIDSSCLVSLKEKRCFCDDCGFEWNEDVDVQVATRKIIDEELNKKNLSPLDYLEFKKKNNSQLYISKYGKTKDNRKNLFSKKNKDKKKVKRSGLGAISFLLNEKKERFDIYKRDEFESEEDYESDYLEEDYYEDDYYEDEDYEDYREEDYYEDEEDYEEQSKIKYKQEKKALISSRRKTPLEHSKFKKNKTIIGRRN